MDTSSAEAKPPHFPWITLGQHEEEEEGNQKTSCYKSVYFRIMKRSPTLTMTEDGKERKTFHFEWFVDKDRMTTSSSKEEKEDVDWKCGFLSPALRKMPSDVLPKGSFSVALGSRIYVLGGVRPAFTSIMDVDAQTVAFYCDVAHPEEDWKRGPAFNIGRHFAKAVAVNGKIYVSGGISHRDDWEEVPYTEVLDPALGKWISLSPPPVFQFTLPTGEPMGLSLGLKNAHPLPNGHILLHGRASLFSYDIEADKFDLLDPYFFIISCRGLAVVDDVLFCFRKDDLVWGYDLVKRRWFPSPVMGLEKGSVIPSGRAFEAFLLYLGGGRLCMVWYPYLGPTNTSTVTINLNSIVFRVKKGTPPDGGEPLLKASIEAKKIYDVQGVQVFDCLAL